MNGKDIFLGLQYVGTDLIEKAEKTTYVSKKRKAIRPLLIAALISLLLMLVGCAVVYVLNMQNMKIGDTTESWPIMADNQMEIIGYEDVDMQVLTLAGLKGTENYKAAQEWYQFTQDYDPHMETYFQLENAGMLEDTPPEFGGMNIYTQEMRGTIDGILAKYHLLPPGELLDFRTLKKMCTALGIEKIQTAKNDVDIRISHGRCRSNGNFYLNMQFSFPENEELRIYDTWGNLYWCRKDCFTPDYFTIEDNNDWKEWNYTTASGSEVLVFRSPSDWRGWIVCQRAEAQLVLQLEVRKDIMSDNEVEYQYLTDRQIEMIADAIDFSIQPNIVVQPEADSQTSFSNTMQNGWNVELKDVKTDGYTVQMLLGITAPENVDITHVEADDVLSHYFEIHPGNDLDYLVPEIGEKNGYANYWQPEDDGDGLDNTQDYRIFYNTTMMDGSVPFGDGTVWDLLIEDLFHYHWNEQKADVEEIVLTEGEWDFTIRFGEENGYYQKLDLLAEPMTLPAVTSWDWEGNQIWGTCQVSDIEIHPMSVHFLGERTDVDYGWVNVVMKDGHRIPASAVNFDRRCIYEALEWIELNQVDYLLLEDGTHLSVK